MDIRQRKKDHVSLTVSGDVAYRKLTGLEQFDFVHNALPETDVDKVDLTARLLGRTFDFPLFISSMTGGYTDAGAVNAIIAAFCEEHNLPFGVGSQRIMLDDPGARESFAVVRREAPNAFIASNIGGGQLIGGLKAESIKLLVDTVEADAMIVHLNPLQELMQPEGDRRFKGMEAGLRQLIRDCPVPVIVKETGAGISKSVARRLIDAGVSVIDVAGSGGTSWARVENKRKQKQADIDADELFDNWGIPTVVSLMDVAELNRRSEIELIASGGIRSSADIIKSLCLGADFTAAAQPVIKAVVGEGYEGLEKLINNWKHQSRMILTLLGCHTMQELNDSMLRVI